MEFDDLKRKWKECDRQLDAAVQLNTAPLRKLLENSGRDGEIDYSGPVLLAQKQIDQLRPHKWLFARAMEEVVEALQSMFLRAFPGARGALRRHRLPRG